MKGDPVVENKVRKALERGEPLTGMLLFTGSPAVVEMMAAAGLDFVIIDMEHSALDLDRAGHLVRAADAAGITPFVRIPAVDAPLIQKLLNLGVAGLVLPHGNRKSCAALLEAMRYAPEGGRGACQITRAAGYVRGGWDAYARRVNREVMAIVLLEEGESIADIETLAATPGLDVFFVGPTDLSISLGVPGATFDDPKMSAALDKVVATVRREGKHVMTLIGNQLDVEYGRRIARRGVQLIVLGTDGDLFMDAIRRINAVKA
jgi:2-keto-3-deoxy-L-rhamnonate aldolase RhmA